MNYFILPLSLSISPRPVPEYIPPDDPLPEIDPPIQDPEIPTADENNLNVQEVH
jgi:hypothetical protein